MLWFLTFHIIALTFWCASQLYLPALIVNSSGKHKALEVPEHWESTARFVFTYVSNPAALATIITGTGVFLLNQTVEPWLFIKLHLVVLLVVVHALTGAVVLRSDKVREAPILLWCLLLAGAFFICMAAILWIVLAKPSEGLVMVLL